MIEHLCVNCKWEIWVKFDNDGIPRCSDCGSEIEGAVDYSDNMSDIFGDLEFYDGEDGD